MLEENVAEEVDPEYTRQLALSVDQLAREITGLLAGHSRQTIELSFAVVIEFLQEHIDLDVPKLVENVKAQQEIMKDKDKGYVKTQVVSKKIKQRN